MTYLPRTLLALLTGLALFAAPTMAQRAVEAGDWPVPNLDAGSSRFSPLTQINAATVGTLAVKWQTTLPKPASAGSGTPIVVGGIMYGGSGATLAAIATKLKEMPGARIVGFNYDTGERYLSVPEFLPGG